MCLKYHFPHLDSKEHFNFTMTGNDINMKHSCLDIILDPCFPIKLSYSIKIILDLQEFCMIKGPKDTIKGKGMVTILNLTKLLLVTTSTDAYQTLAIVEEGLVSFLHTQIMQLQSTGSSQEK